MAEVRVRLTLDEVVVRAENDPNEDSVCLLFYLLIFFKGAYVSYGDRILALIRGYLPRLLNMQKKEQMLDWLLCWLEGMDDPCPTFGPLSVPPSKLLKDCCELFTGILPHSSGALHRLWLLRLYRWPDPPGLVSTYIRAIRGGFRTIKAAFRQGIPHANLPERYASFRQRDPVRYLRSVYVYCLVLVNQRDFQDARVAMQDGLDMTFTSEHLQCEERRIENHKIGILNLRRQFRGLAGIIYYHLNVWPESVVQMIVSGSEQRARFLTLGEDQGYREFLRIVSLAGTAFAPSALKAIFDSGKHIPHEAAMDFAVFIASRAMNEKGCGDDRGRNLLVVARDYLEGMVPERIMPAEEDDGKSVKYKRALAFLRVAIAKYDEPDSE
jgi:hypothetical protein